MDENKAATEGEDTALIPEGWTSAPTLEDLKNDLLEASNSHDTHCTKVRGWLDNLEIKGKAVVNTPKGNSKLVPKLIRKQAEWRYSALSEPFLSTEDLFSVKPKTWEDVESATQNSLVLNGQFNTQIKKVKFIDRYVRTAVNQGTVIVRTGWEFEEETVTETQPIVEFFPNPELGPLHQQLAGMKEEDPTRYKFEVPEELQQAHDMSVQTGVPMAPRITGQQEVEVTRTIKNQPTLDVCDYRNVIIDPSCEGDMDRAGFVIYKFETSLSRLRKSGTKYKNLENIQLTNNSILGDPDHADEHNPSFNFRDDPRKKFIAHEYWGYWDFDGSGIAKPFVATWVGSTLIRMEENPFPDKSLPFVVVAFLPVDGSITGEPDGELLEDNQKVIGAVTRGMMDIMAKSANGQTGVRKGTLDATNRHKFKNGQDYEYNGNVDPRVAFHMHTFPEIPNSAQYLVQQQAMEAESMTGVKAFSQGINGNALGESVGNGRSVLDAASKRETGILRRLADGIVDIGRKVIAMNAEFLDEEEVIRVTNEEFVPIRRDDLAGNYDLSLTISTAEEDASKADRLEFMLQTMGNNMDPGMTKILLRDAARLRKMPELAHAIEKYEPQPDPHQEALNQLELQLKQAEIAKVVSETNENYANAQLDGAKAGTEGAKQRQLGSTADKSDLDFVEQESGVTQERAKELHGEQARSQMQLKEMDHKHDALKEYLGKKAS
jgi:hypothetical protein